MNHPVENLLTEDQFFINEVIENQIRKDFDDYQFHLKILQTNSESIPLLHYTYHLLEEFENLSEKLMIAECYNEFAVNSFYYLIQQQFEIKCLEGSNDDGENQLNITELAMHEVRKLYESYNQ